MKKIFLYLGAALLAAAALTSCNKDFTAAVSPDGLNGPEIAIRTNSAMTKSAMSGTAFPQGYDMLVSAYRNLGSHSGGDTAQDYFEGIRFGYDGDASAWKSEMGPKYYPLDGTLDFLAIAGAGLNDAATGIVPTAVWGDESSNVAQKVVLTVPDNSAQFDDLMYASANARGFSASGTAMTFHHAMSSVVFTAKCNVAYSAGTNVGITIDGITLDGAKYSGTLTVNNPSAGGGSGDLSAEWSSLGSAQEHIAARVWDDSNTGIHTDESDLSALNLTATAMTVNASHPFGEAYVILPPQNAVPFTVTYTIHNGFASNGSTPLDKQVQYQYSPSGSWDMNKKNVYEIYFNLTEILVNPSIVDWDAVDAELVPVPTTIAGLTIAAGPLFYNGTSYEIKDSWNFDSYNSVYGKNNGSYYFSFIEMGQLFEKADFSTSYGNIENLLDPLSGWRLPTKAEWQAIVGTTRAGSTVNGSANKHYALIKLTDPVHAGSATPNGLLIFPDNKTITGKTLSGMDDNGQTTDVTLAELNAYLEQGCVFLPASGGCGDGTWTDGGNYGNYWSSTENNESHAYCFGFADSNFSPNGYSFKSFSYYPVRLVRY